MTPVTDDERITFRAVFTHTGHLGKTRAAARAAPTTYGRDARAPGGFRAGGERFDEPGEMNR